MMSELIDRNALIDALMTYTWQDEDEHLIDDWDEKRRFIEDWLPSLPTIEAEPVRHAHWNGWTATHWTKKCDEYGDPIFKEHKYYQCSKCRRRTVIKSAYCPACGCKMDEVSE